MSFPLITQISFEQEKAINDPMHSYEWVANNYRKTFNPKTRHGLYEWEPITFAETEIVQTAGKYFEENGIYTDAPPGTRQFKLFWDREEYRRKNGITVPIKVPPGGANSKKDLLPVWIPGDYYGHLNYGPIKRTVDPADADIERALKNSIDLVEKSNKITNFEKEQRLKALFSGLSDKTVADKKYGFPDFWDGHFHTYVGMGFAATLGLDYGTLKSRRKGFSYIGAWKAFDTYDLIPRSTVLLIAFDIKYLNKGKEALFNMVKEYAKFINEHTDWYKNTLSDNQEYLKSGYTLNGVQGEFGWKSEVMCLTAMDNPSCARGKDAKLVLYEECGSFPNLTETRIATKAAAEEGGYVVGQSLYWGTVGKNTNEMAGLLELVNEPFGNDCLPFKNVYGSKFSAEATCQFFGYYQNLVGAIDKNGNSDLTKAIEVDRRQDEIKRRTDNYVTWRAERPRSIDEAVTGVSNNLFKEYHDLIELQLDKIKTTHKNIGICGKYVSEGGTVSFISNKELESKDIKTHPPIYTTDKNLPKDYDMHGCIVEYDVPYTTYIDDGTGKNKRVVPKKLYGIWHDPFATNKEEGEEVLGGSMGVAYVFEYANNLTSTKGGRIVASWIGRPASTDAYNEQLFLMAKRWNAEILFENDRGVVYEYAVPRRLTSYLKEEPEFLSMKEISGKTGRKYGISIGKHRERKAKGLLLLYDFLKEPLGVNSLGTTETFIHHFYCARGLEEIKTYNAKGNFDCVSTLVVGMYDVRESIDQAYKNHETETSEPDDFWDRFSN